MINFVDKIMFGKGNEIFLDKTIVLRFYYESLELREYF